MKLSRIKFEQRFYGKFIYIWFSELLLDIFQHNSGDEEIITTYISRTEVARLQ